MRQLDLRILLRGGLAAMLFVMSQVMAWADDTQGLPATYVTVTNQPSQVINGTFSNLNSFVKLRLDRGLAISWLFNNASGATSNGIVNIYSSTDGTNVSTAPFAVLSAPSSGTTVIVANTNWSSAALAGYDSLVIGNITNSAPTVLTNKGFIIRRPN